MKALFAALVTVVAVSAASASSYYDGYVAEDGYTYNNGYWWKGGYGYKWEPYWVAGSSYYSYGRWYTTPGYWAYKYVYYPNAEYAKPAAKSAYTDPDWRSKLLDIAATRDKYEAQARRAAYEQRSFLEAVGALGLQGNFRWDGYGTSPYPAGYGGGGGSYSGYAMPLNGIYTHQFQLGSYGANASTLYGSTYKQLADPYGDANLSQLYQQASRLAESAQKLGGQATSDFSALVQSEGGNRARVAEILARAEAARQFMQTLDGPPRAETSSVEVRSSAAAGSTGAEQATPALAATQPPKARFDALWKAKCASCHTGAAAKGKFTLDSYAAMKPDEKLAVWARLVTKDRDKMMPRAKDGGPGEYLSRDEVRFFTEN